jgi:hypothetical protein
VTCIVEAKLFGLFKTLDQLFLVEMGNLCFMLAKQNLCNSTLALLFFLSFKMMWDMVCFLFWM